MRQMEQWHFQSTVCKWLLKCSDIFGNISHSKMLTCVNCGIECGISLPFAYKKGLSSSSLFHFEILGSLLTEAICKNCFPETANIGRVMFHKSQITVNV